jgi:hypothetical protein
MIFNFNSDVILKCWPTLNCLSILDELSAYRIGVLLANYAHGCFISRLMKWTDICHSLTISSTSISTLISSIFIFVAYWMLFSSTFRCHSFSFSSSSIICIVTRVGDCSRVKEWVLSSARSGLLLSGILVEHWS